MLEIGDKMMEYIEKELKGKDQESELMDFSMIEKMAKFPRFLLKFILKKKINKIRESMGGDSKDITTQPIITKDKNIPG
ncbi:unnamed protein product, partial [marine sediment metagenome]